MFSFLVRKFNPYRDSQGRYTTGPGAGAKAEAELKSLGLDIPHEEWAKHIKVSPKEFFGAILGENHLHERNMRRLSVSLEAGKMQVRGANIEVHGSVASSLERHFDFLSGVAKHHLLVFFAQHQKAGAAKSLMRKSTELYDKVGITKIKLNAGLEMGAYTWAKYGFRYLNSTHAEGHAQEIRSNLDEALSNHHIPAAAQREVDMLNHLLDNPTLNTNQLVANMKTPELDKALASSIRKVVPSKGTTAKLLMSETMYDGVMNLDNPKHRERLDTYLKG